MQTTLLGLAIAFIIALIAALVGPYYVDWNQFRPQFEAEASRIIGSPVRVAGALDARLLPTPTLRLKSVSIGAQNDPSRVRAEKLDVEFSLASLMRGEWRASELSLQGLDLDFGLDRQGRIDWPASQGYFDFSSLAIDRLNLAGRAVLHDGASGGRLTLDDLKFSGDVRALAGALRGEGSARIGGAQVPFRISSGEAADGKGARVRLTLGPGGWPVSADLDGHLTFDARSPRFDGTLVLARTSGTPWRMTGRVKADPRVATFEQVEAAYGPDDVALKLSGSGDLRLEAQPLLHMALSAQQLDADRLFLKGQPEGATVHLIPGLRALIASVPPPTFPVQIDLSADQIALGGRPVRDVTAAFHGNGKAWAIDGIALRAPGESQLAARGTLNGQNAAAIFAGPVELESGNPAVLVSWLQGSSDVAFRSRKPLRINGKVALSADGFSLEGMKADFDGGAIQGNIALSNARFDATLKSASLDLDATTELARALSGPRTDWPGEAHVSLDVARGILAGQEVRPVAVEFSYGPKTVSIDRLKLGGAGGVAVEGGGMFDRTAGTGKFALDASAASLSRFGEVIKPFAPAVAERLKAVNAAKGSARARIAVDVSKAATGSGRTEARAVLDLEGSGIKGRATLTAAPEITAAGLDLDALAKSEMTLEARFTSEQGQALLALAGVDGVLTAGDGPARLESSMQGTWRGATQFKAKVIGNGLDADMQGRGDVWTAEPKATVALVARKVNLEPLFGTGGPLPVSLTSRLVIAGDKLTFEDLDSTVNGSRIRGKLTVTRGDVTGVDGEIGMDAIDLSSLMGLALGTAGHAATEPVRPGWVQGWRGRIAFTSLRGRLPGGGELRPVSGEFSGDGQSFVLDGLKAGLGGGEVTATVEGRQTADGLAVSARAQMAGIDGAALKYRGLAMPEGRVALKVTLMSRGRSLAALSGGLSGSGVVSLQNAKIAGLDPRAFDAAIRAGDLDQVADDRKVKTLVDPVLAQGALQVASADIPFDIRDGRLRVGATTLDGTNARAVVSGGYDIAADQVNVRAALSSNATGMESARPEIQVFLHGTPDALDRDVDITSLSSWLMLRAIDRETRRLDRLQGGAQPSALAAPPADPKPPRSGALPPSDVRIPNGDPRKRAPAAKPPTAAGIPPHSDTSAPASRAPPLPPPIDIRPAPGILHQKPRPPSASAPPRASF